MTGSSERGDELWGSIKCRGNSSLAEGPLPSQEEACSMLLVSYIVDSPQHRWLQKYLRSTLDGESGFCRFLSTRIFDNVIRLPDLTLHNMIS